MDLNLILLFIEQLPLQFDFFGGGHGVLGSDDPIVKGLIASMSELQSPDLVFY